MRIKLFVTAGCIGAIVLGAAVSNASLTSGTSVNVNIKSPGAPATITLAVDNSESTLVPQPVTVMKISSTTAKWNSKAVPNCTVVPPDWASGTPDNGHGIEECPAASKVGRGTFTVNTGTPGQPIPGDNGTISGTINVYNRAPAAGQSAAFLIELLSDVPVPNDHEYEVAQISKSGTVTVPLLKMENLTPAIHNLLSPPMAPRQLALSKLQVTIKSPTPKKGKAPFVTLKSVSKVNFSVSLQRGS